MKKNLLLGFLFSLAFTAIYGQTTILDFEDAATSTTFQYFGSTLENELSNVIANPDPSGVNTSAMVSDFTKPADSEVWAGAFANPVTIPIDVIGGNEICMDVWFPNTGNVALKLEGGTSPNWITTQDVTVANAWTTICFNSADASIEDPFGPAAGGVYDQLVLFFDFGTAFTEEQVYYFDNVIVSESNLAPSDVTFNVDMNDYDGSFTTVYVSGTFNDWAADSNPMTDDDGDGIYTATLADLPAGTHEYKFQVDAWTDQENFDGNYTCTVTDPSGQFTNRRIVVSADAVLDPVAWESCYAAGEAVLITVNLGTGDIDVDETGLYIAGGTGFGVPGDNQLVDSDNDGIYSITIERETGFTSHYTFTNGACGDWSCKENIAGQTCADVDNFNDRLMGPVTDDLVISTCFGICTETADCAGGGMVQVSFAVDLTDEIGTFTTAYVAGQFNNWSGDANPLSDTDGDGIYSTVIEMLPGGYEYKFEFDNWATAEEFADGAPCTVTDASGQFVNRFIEVGNAGANVCFDWNSCDECEAPADALVTFEVDMNDYTASFNTVFVSGQFNDWAGNSNPLADDDGDGVWSVTLPLSPGMYEYKFQLDEWAVPEEFTDGDPCTVTDESGQFVNRIIDVSGDTQVCFDFNTCNECGESGVSDLSAADNIFTLQPSLVYHTTTLKFNTDYNQAKEAIVFNAVGEIMMIKTIDAGSSSYELNVSDMASGLYFINVQTAGSQQTQRFVVNK